MYPIHIVESSSVFSARPPVKLHTCVSSILPLPPPSSSSSSSQELNYTLTVVATDNGQPEPFNNTATVLIEVFSPDNFFEPVLDRVAYTGSVEENAATNFTVVSFTVSDGDLIGPASQIGAAQLIGTDAALFNVFVTGPNSGVIVTS